ncbi:uncharacterized protein LOC125050044 [Pieris napi]|uniref:uncharacterized protein LOC125050044 n=1 Tax=Pieris napi TaxID=78633 RepID=UPI001FB9B1FA|nr:uncharacterized protein LOC125050044 [Pieris napi]
MKDIAKLIVILGMFCVCQSYIRQPNVGTVLFSPKDLHKHRWTQSELASLRARRHFQNLIPSPKLTHSISDEYLSHLVNYVENCYTTVIDEAVNPTEKDLMTNALSDVVGGYLKVWVLPITKYAYYGGTISPINAIKLFQMYDNIKQSLKTDGRTWSNPNADSLQTVTINIASNPHEWFARSTRESCDNLSYYEKTDKGLTIPLPYINWDLFPQTMFIPLKDQSLIQLNSPNSSNALLDYYNVATSCIHSLNIGTIDDFGSRFQIWLSTDVVPHLKDDDLYVAFGSCLSLLNKTKGLYGNVVNLCDNAYSNLRCKAASAGFPIPLTKKSMLIAFILLIEVIWCIPVLYYLLCGKKPKKKRGVKQFFSYFKKDPTTLHGVKLFVKPRTRNLELDVEFPTYDHKYYMKSTSTNMSRNNVFNNFTHINESLKKCLANSSESKHALNNNVCPNISAKSSNLRRCNCKPTCDNITSCYITNRKAMNSSSNCNSTPSSFILLEENEIKNLSYTHATLSVSKSTLKSRPDMKLCSNLNSSKICPCTSCIKNGTERNVQLRQSFENIEKTSIKVKSPIVMKIINEDKKKCIPSFEKHLTQKFDRIQTDSTKGKESKKGGSTNENKETKILKCSLKKKGDENNKKTIAVTKNSILQPEKFTGKATKISTENHGNVQSGKSNKLLPVKDSKQNNKALKTCLQNIKTDKIQTPTSSIKTKITTKVSTRDKSAIAEVPKEHKNIQNVIADNGKPVFKVAKSIKTEMSNIAKGGKSSINNDTLKEISKHHSTIPKPSNLPHKTIISPEPGKKTLIPKPCKIPKRILTTPLKDLKEPIATSPKTLGKVRKKALDDSAIKKTNKNNKLNTTL